MKDSLYIFKKICKVLIFAVLFLDVSCEEADTKFIHSTKKNGMMGMTGDFPVYCISGDLALDDKKVPQNLKPQFKAKSIEKEEQKVPTCTNCLLTDEMLRPDEFIRQLKREIKFKYARKFWNDMNKVKENKPNNYIDQFKHVEDFCNELESDGYVREEFYTVEKLQSNLDSIQNVDDPEEQEKVQALINVYQECIDFMNNEFNPVYKPIIGLHFSLENINKEYTGQICSSEPNGGSQDPLNIYQLDRTEYIEFLKSKFTKLTNKKSLVII